MQSTALILGARSRFGLAAARAFADAGGSAWLDKATVQKIQQGRFTYPVRAA